MTTRYGVEYDVEMLYSGAANLDRAERDLDDFTQKMEQSQREVDQASSKAGDTGSFKKATDGWADIAGAVFVAGQAFQAAGAIAQEAYALLGDGAELSKTADQFERLSASIGSSGDSILAALQASTQGMISNSDLIGSAVDIINLGLADTEDGVARLGGVVGTLGLDMQVLTLTLANQSVARLDSLGLAIDDVKSKQKELEAAGYSTEAAFSEAVISALEYKQELLGLGDGSTNAAAELAKVEAAVQNIRDGFSQGLAEGFLEGFDGGELAGDLNDAAVAAGDLGDALGKAASLSLPAVISGVEKLNALLERSSAQSKYNDWAQDAVDLGKVTEEQLREIVTLIDSGDAEMFQAGMEMMQAFEDGWRSRGTISDDAIADSVTERLRVSGEQRQAAEAAAEELADAFDEGFKKKFEALTIISPEVGSRIGEGIANAVKYADIGDAILEQQGEAEEAARQLGEEAGRIMADAMSGYLAQSGDQFTDAISIDFSDGEQFDMAQYLYDMTDAGDASASTLANLALAMGQLTEAEAAAALQGAFLMESLENIGTAIAQGQIDPEVGYGMAEQLWSDFEEGIDIVGNAAAYTIAPEITIEWGNVQGDDIQQQLEEAYGGDDAGWKTDSAATIDIGADVQISAEDVQAAIESIPEEDKTVLMAATWEEGTIPDLLGSDGLGQITDPEGGSFQAPVTISPTLYEEIGVADAALDGLVAERTAVVRVQVVEEYGADIP